ncbi:MAG: hypothetical protein HQK57_02610 [Deltaproteobacteria bacterium]|nr:hypothetical protein [Deltaproteobacteria bacterium]MBF0527052.1 hypothetical protein [Deltaproteobacteria bacterium]
MKTFTLKFSDDSVDDSVMEAIKGFLKTLPQQVELVPGFPQNWDHIPYVDDEEQAEIEESLKNPDCHIVSSSRKVMIEI